MESMISIYSARFREFALRQLASEDKSSSFSRDLSGRNQPKAMFEEPENGQQQLQY